MGSLLYPPLQSHNIHKQSPPPVRLLTAVILKYVIAVTPVSNAISLNMLGAL